MISGLLFVSIITSIFRIHPAAHQPAGYSRFLKVKIRAAGAATSEEMTRLEAAYPAGSVVICRQDLPGDGMARLPTRLEVRGTVLSREVDLTTGQGIATWTPDGNVRPGLSHTFTVMQRKNVLRD